MTRMVIRGASLAGMGYVLAQVLTLGFYLALARLATPADFGELAAGSILVGVTLLVSDSGMMAALIHRRDRIEEAAATAVISTFLGGLVLAVIALALSPLIGTFFDSDRIGEVAAVMSGVIFLRSLDTVPSAILQRRFSFLRRTIVEPASAIAFGVAAVIATSEGMGVWGLVIGQYAAACTEVILSWSVTRWRPQMRLANFGMWRELIAYGRHVLVASMIQRAGDQADTLWLGRFVSAASLGQYRYAFRLASTPFQALLAAAGYVLFPAFARIADEPDRFEAAFMRSLRWICVIGFPAGLILVPLGEPLAVLLFGDVWRQAGEAAAAMCLFCGGSCLGSMAGEALKAHGSTKKLTDMHTFTTLVTAALMGLLLIPFGLEGVAAGLSAGAVIGGLYSLRVAHKTIGFPLRPMWTQIWPPLVAALVMTAALVPIELSADSDARDAFEAALILIGEVLIAVGIYGIALRLFGPSLITELEGPAGAAWARLTRADDEPAAERAAAALADAGPGPATPAVGISTETSGASLPGPRFSVVIAAFNAEATLGAAIESVMKQTETDWELIVVDDGSTDGTAALARSYEERDRRMLAYTQRNSGPSGARNRGIRFSRGRTVSFLDSDDLLMPDYLREMAAALDGAPRAAIAYTDAWSLDDRTRRIHKASAMSTALRPEALPDDPAVLLTELVRSNFILASATVRRAALEAAGGYDESLGFAEDYDLWLRIVRAGHGAVRAGGLLVIQRERGDSLSKDEAGMLRGIAAVLARVADDPAAPAEARATARERIAELDSRVAGLEGRAKLTGARIRARHAAGGLRRRVGGGPSTYDTPPPEVAAAFPELFGG